MVRVRRLFANIELSYGVDEVYIRNQIIEYAHRGALTTVTAVTVPELRR